MVLKQISRLIFRIATFAIAYFVGASIAVLLLVRIAYQRWKYPSKKVSTKRRELPPACLNDSSYGEHSYIQIRNIKLHYVENGDKTKPLMLFFHGFPDFWFSWRHQLKYFSKHYWTVAVDMRGFGDSEKPTGISQYKIKYVMNDFKNLINAFGRDKCILVAHDWGSIIGWYFLLKYPDMIEKYVMIGIPPLFNGVRSWRQYLKSWYIFFFFLPYLPEWFVKRGDYKFISHVFRDFSDEEREVYKYINGKPGAPRHSINYYRANILKLAFPYQEKSNDVNLPSGLLIYTDNDEYVDEANFKDVETRVENLEAILIKSATHFIHQYKPDETNKTIAKFLGLDIDNEPGKAKIVQLNDET